MTMSSEIGLLSFSLKARISKCAGVRLESLYASDEGTLAFALGCSQWSRFFCLQQRSAAVGHATSLMPPTCRTKDASYGMTP